MTRRLERDIPIRQIRPEEPLGWVLTAESTQLIKQTLARNVRLAREQAGLSQAGLAEICTLHGADRVYQIENGKQEPRISTLIMVAMNLGIPLARLLDGLPNPR